MKQCKRMIASIVEIILGLILSYLGFIGVLDDFWSGMGTALLIVGIIMLIRQIRYQTNDSYRENVDVEVNDERNKYIATKAWSWAGYLYVIIAAVATITFKLLGQEILVYAASGSICIIVVLYWISNLILRRKY